MDYNEQIEKESLAYIALYNCLLDDSVIEDRAKEMEPGTILEEAMKAFSLYRKE